MFFPRRGRAMAARPEEGMEAPRPSPANDLASAVPAPEREHPALRGALLESRLRWQDFVTLSADLAFETDARGTLTFVSPADALGHDGNALVGQQAATLLLDPGMDGLDPFAAETPYRGRKAWVRQQDGTARCMVFAAAPLLDGTGRRCGIRGVATDVTVQDAQERASALALRRAETLEHLLSCVRTELLAADGMRCLLSALVASEGAAAAAIVRLTAAAAIVRLTAAGGDAPVGFDILHSSVADVRAIVEASLPLVREAAAGAAPDGMGRAVGGVAFGRPVLAGHVLTPFAEDTVLLLWREPGAGPFNPDDERLAASVMGIVRVVLEHEMVQRQLAASTRTDPLTGVLHASAFNQELPRYIDRLDRDGEPGTAMHVDLDGFRAVNEAHGYAVGDAVLVRMATLLRETVRPTDVVARMGGNLFAVWLQGADHLTAAERAERLRTETPAILRQVLVDGRARSLSVSIGIASRRAGSDEPAEDVMRRAADMLSEVKAAGAAHWRVSPVPADHRGLPG